MSQPAASLKAIETNVQFVCEDSIRAYLDALFFGVDWQPGQFVCVRGIGEKGTDQEAKHREDLFYEPAVTPDFAEAVIMHATRWAQWHVAAFIVPAVLSEANGSAKSVGLFTNVVVDLDGGNTDERLAWIVEHVGEPTMIVESGGITEEGTAKRHVYFGLSEPTSDIGAVVSLRDVLARKVGGCLSMGLGVPGNPYGRAHQPIRIAGTCHSKNGKAAGSSIVTTDGPRLPTALPLGWLGEKITDAPPSPWAIKPESATAATAADPAAQRSFIFQPETLSDTDKALMEDISSDGDGDSTRFARFSQVAGYFIAMARRDKGTLADALAETLGWMHAKMSPPWGDAKAEKEFYAIANCDLRAKGALPEPEAPIVLPENAAVGLQKFAAYRWMTDPPPEHTYLVDKLIIKGENHLMVAEGGAGKTGLIADLAMKIAAHGRAPGPLFWCGHEVRNGGCVCVILCEDSPLEMNRRYRHIDKGRGLIEQGKDRLLVMTMTECGGAFPLAEKDGPSGGTRTGKKWGEILLELGRTEQHGPIALVVIDTLNSVSHGDENSAVVIGEMMREANRVCGTLGAALLCNHHVRKAGNEPLNSMEDLRNSIRGSSAIPSAFRINFGMFHSPDYARRMKAMGLPPRKHALWRFGIAKSNIGGMLEGEMTLLRNPSTGLLEDATAADKFSVVNMGERSAWLLAAIAAAASRGHPYTSAGRGGSSGLYARRSELPSILRSVGPGEFAGLVEDALQNELLVLASVKGSAAKSYLDTPDGPLATNDMGEELSKGAYAPPLWNLYTYDPAQRKVVESSASSNTPAQPVGFSPSSGSATPVASDVSGAAAPSASAERRTYDMDNLPSRLAPTRPRSNDD